MEALPALGPVIGNLAPRHLNHHPTNVSGPIRKRGQLTRHAIHGELDKRIPIDLLNTAGSKFQQSGKDLLGLFPARPEREPDQWNARFNRCSTDSRSCRLSSVSV